MNYFCNVQMYTGAKCKLSPSLRRHKKCQKYANPLDYINPKGSFLHQIISVKYRDI